MPLDEKSRQQRGRGTVGVVAGRRRKSGLIQVSLTLSPEQLAALRREAFRRAAEAGHGKPDASIIVRELLDAWLAKAAKR